MQLIESMFKYHKFVSFVIGLLYVVVLQKFSTPYPVFRFLIPAFLIFCLAASYYNKVYLKSLGKYNVWLVVRLLLLYISGFGIFMLLPNMVIRGLFLTVTLFVIFLFQMTMGRFAENLMINETLVIAFGFFITLCGFNQYYLTFGQLHSFFGGISLPDWEFSLQPFYLAGTFACSYLLARCFYEFIPQPSLIKVVISLSIALFTTETFWALTFLPFHFSAIAVVLLSVFYFCLILNYYHLFHTLTYKKIQFHLILIIIASAIAIISTPWTIIE